MKKAIIILITLLSINTINASEERSNEVTNQLFETMKLSETYQQTIERLLDLQITQNPNIATLKDVMLQFFEKYMGWKSIKDDMAKIYMKNFTDDELKELINFYQSPIGKKAAALLPTLAAEGSALGERRVQENMGELSKMIQDKLEETKRAIP